MIARRLMAGISQRERDLRPMTDLMNENVQQELAWRHSEALPADVELVDSAGTIFTKRTRVVNDLLLTDMVMPEQSGRALAEQLLRSRPAMRVVYMSGYTDERVTQEGALGADDHFIEKPSSQESLLRKVRAVLDET